MHYIYFFSNRILPILTVSIVGDKGTSNRVKTSIIYGRMAVNEAVWKKKKYKATNRSGLKISGRSKSLMPSIKPGSFLVTYSLSKTTTFLLLYNIKSTY